MCLLVVVIVHYYVYNFHDNTFCRYIIRDLMQQIVQRILYDIIIIVQRILYDIIIIVQRILYDIIIIVQRILYDIIMLTNVHTLYKL